MSQATAEQQIITFWVPAEEKAKLEEIAAREERSLSAVMRLLVRERITKEGA